MYDSRSRNRISMGGTRMGRPCLLSVGLIASLMLLAPGASAQPVAAPLTKAAVGEKIRRVEDGVGQFRKYLEQRGENARSTAAA
jgi:hypothetical protein